MQRSFSSRTLRYILDEANLEKWLANEDFYGGWEHDGDNLPVEIYQSFYHVRPSGRSSYKIAVAFACKNMCVPFHSTQGFSSSHLESITATSM